MKKLLSILICIVLVVSSCLLLVGCSKINAEATLYQENLVSEVTNKGNRYTIKLNGKHYVDTMLLEERSDNIKSFTVHGKEADGTYTLMYRQNRIDKYRLCAMDGMETDELRIDFDKNNVGKTVKINNIEVYNSTTTLREQSFRVTEYLMTTDRKLYNNRNEGELFNHLKVVDDLIVFGDISIGEDANILFNEGEQDFDEDLKIIKEYKNRIDNLDMNLIVNIDVRSKVIPADTAPKKVNKTLKKWMKTNYKTVAANIAEFANRIYGIDKNDGGIAINGINIDWDYPENGTQWSYLSKLIVELDQLLEEGKFVTITLKPDECKLTKKARNAIDYVNLTAYDMFDDRGEHSSNYETCKHLIETFTKKSKFTNEKIMLGLPLFGRTINGSNNIFLLNEQYKNNKEIDKWVNKVYNYKYIDELGGAIYSEVYYNGYAMIRDKTTYAIASGLGGVSLFQLTYDLPASWEYNFHNAVKEAVVRGVKPVEG